MGRAKDRPPFSSSMLLSYISSLSLQPHHLNKIAHSLLPPIPSKTDILAVAKAVLVSLPNFLLSTAKGLQVRI